MFSWEHWQIKLVYAGFGFLFTVLGMIVSFLATRRKKFGNIECTKLSVMDAEGKAKTVLKTDEHGGRVVAHGKNGDSRVVLSIGEHGGKVAARGENGKSLVWLGIGEHGAYVNVRGEHGANVNVREKNDKSRVRLIVISNKNYTF